MQIEVRNLSIGTELENDIYDDHGVLLLKAGQPVTERFLQVLRNRGIRQVKSDAPTPTNESVYHSATSRALDEAVDACADQVGHVSDQWPSEKARPFTRRGVLSVAQRSKRLAHTRQRLGNAIGRFMIAGPAVAAGSLDIDLLERDLVEVAKLVGDDPYTALLARELRGGDAQLYEEGIHAAVVAIAIAVYMGFGDADIMDVGFATMFSDLGLLRLPDAIRAAPYLNAEQRRTLEQHPVHTADALDQAGAKLARQIIAYQTHERVDGSGYPRKRHGMFITPLARIAGIAHAFITRCAARPHRPAMLPYDAMVAILQASRAGRFDTTAVRAFLDVMSLFPIGSCVELSDERAARVWQSNLKLHTDPVVAVIDGRGKATDELIDLAKVRTVKIVRAIPNPMNKCA